MKRQQNIYLNGKFISVLSKKLQSIILKSFIHLAKQHFTWKKNTMVTSQK